MKKKHSRFVLAFVFWIALLAISLVTMPNISSLVREKGQITLPDDVQSQVATTINQKMTNSKNGTEIIAVFHSDDKLTDKENKQINQKITDLKENQDTYKIDSITSAQDNTETKEQVVSKDKTTQLALITLKDKTSLESQVAKIQKELAISDLDVSITGSDVLNDEFSKTTEEGIKKTEIIAALFIFVVLILVFRSPIVPVLSLSTVGISLVVSLNIIMNLAKYVDFPISNFTQVFLVVVLFGIGTDYNILLYDHFKEELSRDLAIDSAVKNARNKAGRTILYSGSAVLIGFVVLALAKFQFYQSAVGVAIGVAVLLLNLLTLNPFFMRNLGKKMFWPSKNFNGSSSSKLWHGLAKFAVNKPAITLALIALFTVPFALNYNQTLNYNNADEIPDSNSAKSGYLTIQDHFSKGMTAPTTLYIESDSSLVNQEDLATIDQLTDYLAAEDNVKTVTSVTRPSGDKIDAFYLDQQLATITDNLTKVSDGLNTIEDGLNQAGTQLQSSNTEQQTASIQELTDGAASLQTGSEQLASGINQYTQGVDTLGSQLGTSAQALTSSSTQLTTSAQQVASGAAQVNAGVQQVNEQLQSVSTQSTQLSSGLTNATTGLEQAKDGLASIKSYLNEMGESYVGDEFYIPKDSLNASELQPSYDMYLSDNRKIAKITLVLKNDPSTLKSAQTIEQLTQDTKAKIKGTSLENAKIAFGGQSSQTNDLETLANSDFNRTVCIMLIGIGIALIFVTHSVIQPLAIILTLGIAYISSLGITKLLSSVLIGKDLLTWNTPFFSFIMLVALGVDYSIFLMMRYRDSRKNEGVPPVQGIIEASTVIGAVVLSAAVILGGTFAALIPSGVTTLIQVALTVIIGLVLLVFLLPLVLSAVIKLSSDK
ncbi:MAG: MMPL family transporter [Enterococcus sp.]